ncbi:hypothetical protein K438DRAFT_2010136 [Mycena galopus ATCC 62051]|nr:hypothetical protein K438DRAFT_2010136 [Mycena galopus ATCC 62051]
MHWLAGPSRRGGSLHVAFQRAVTSTSSPLAGPRPLVIPHPRPTRTRCTGTAERPRGVFKSILVAGIAVVVVIAAPAVDEPAPLERRCTIYPPPCR